MGVGERRPFRADQKVAREREFESAGDRSAVDRADDRCAHVGRDRRRRATTAERALGEIVQVEPRTECRVGTSNHDRGDIRGGIERRDRFTQPTDQQCVQGIADSGPVEPHGRYLTIHINVQDIIHGPRSTIPA